MGFMKLFLKAEKGFNAKVIEKAIGCARTALTRLDDIMLGEISVASASFKKQTAVVDGWHIGISASCRGALRALASILNTIELFGEFPVVTRSLALIESDTGGHRPIGVFKTLFRVWARVRKKLWASWENSTDPDHLFGAGANMGGSDGLGLAASLQE